MHKYQDHTMTMMLGTRIGLREDYGDLNEDKEDENRREDEEDED